MSDRGGKPSGGIQIFSDKFYQGSRLARTLNVILAGVLVTLLLWGVSRMEFFSDLERSTYDLRFRLSPSPDEADERIVLVLLDGGSMDKLPWPVPRQLYSDVLGLLQDWGAEVVGFDILFDLPSVYSAVEDSLFGETASGGSTTFVMALLQRQGAAIPDNAILPALTENARLDSAWFCTPPNERIASGAEILGSTSDRQDPDGVFRNIRLFTGTPQGIAPSFPVAVSWLYMGKPEIRITDGHVEIGDRFLYTRGGTRLQLKFHGPAGTYRSLPLADITAALNARALGEPCPVDSTIFQGSIVLVGYAAPALYDLKPTPYSAQCPGVEVLATAIDNILNNRYMVKLPGWVTLMAALAVSLLSAIFLSSVKKIPVGALTAALPTVILLAVSLLLFRNNIWLETVWPASSGVLTILAGGIYLFSSENRRRQEVRNAFSQYLSPDVVAQVTENPETLVLGGDKRYMTVFFSDIRGFTGFSEKLQPEELVSLLNIYLTTLTDIILDTGGTVDKFEGDAIIAFWGAPLYLQDHASRACRAALRCREAHVELNEKLARDGYPEIFTRMGMATGDMVVGNMGSSRRFDYTVIGSTVNLGSRLEGTNKVYDTDIIVQEETCRNASEDFIFRELDTVRVVGQQKPTTIYQLICRRGELDPKTELILSDYAAALELYRNGNFSVAAKAFSAIEDATSARMAERCRQLRDEYGDGSREWDGIFSLSSK